MEGSLRVNASGICFVGFGMGGLTLNLISIKFNTYSFYFYLLMFSISISSIGFFFLIETPFWQYSQNNIKGLYSTLSRINRFNHDQQREAEILKDIQEQLMFDGEKILQIEKNSCIKPPNSLSISQEEVTLPQE